MINTEGLNILKKWESCKLKSYYDTGQVLTIGWGHTGPEVKFGMTITQDQADQYLLEDIKEAEIGIDKHVKVPLNENEKSALISFVYNVGVGQFSKSTLLRKLNKNDKEGAAKEFNKWIYDNEKKLQGLINRRKDESTLFLTPVKTETK